MLKIAIVLGTRPEIIKMAPIIKECKTRGIQFCIIHTGQHYSFSMDKIFFEQISLPEPDFTLEVGSGPHGAQTAKIITGVENVVSKYQPDYVLVQGDTNTVLGAAIAVSKLRPKLGHVEAGLRSMDMSMPEEVNRILTDHCSDILFAPTEFNQDTLLKEGIPREIISVTGNTIVDAVYQNIELSRDKSNILQKIGVSKTNYLLVTLHRQENVDNLDRFKGIMKALDSLYNRFNYTVLYPIHPRSKKNLAHSHLKCKDVKFLEPLDYFSFLQLEMNAKLILTDSGGVQEEACIMKVPCVTLRENTERVETIKIGANLLAGVEPVRITESVYTMLHKRITWQNPFGDGHASSNIIEKMLDFDPN